MIIVKKSADIQKILAGKRAEGKKIGFVPTMGALHLGHQSLISKSVDENDITVCSLFVNPTQFNDPEDFKKYPVTLDADIRLLENNDCDVVFIPSIDDIYPDKTEMQLTYEIGALEIIFEGKYRPGHFQGVCKVMHRLLEIVMPDNLYMGRKDYQQCMVVNKLIELLGWNGTIKLVVCPTARELDGLAFSSRNLRLDEEQRKVAATIFQALSYMKKNIQPGSTKSLKEKATRMLEDKGFNIDYISIADADSLQETESWDGKQKVVALAAAYLDGVRLIDNMPLN